MPKVSEEHKTAVRARLILAAIDCFRERGYERMSIRDVLAKSGLSAGAFYHYFNSKDDLVASVGEAIAEVELGGVSLGSSEWNSAGEGIAEIATSIFRPREAFSLLPLSRAQAAHVPAIRESIASYDRRMIKAVTPFTKQAQTDGDLRDDVDVEALTELALTVFEGIQARAHAKTFVTSYSRVASTFLRLLALGAAPEGSRYRKKLLEGLEAKTR